MKKRAISNLAAAALSTAAFVLITGPATAQSAPDPLVSRMQTRIDAIEESVQRATGRVEQSGFQVSQLRKTIDLQANEISQLKQALAAQNERIKKLEALVNAPANAAASAASGPAETVVPLVGPTDPATKQAIAAQRDQADESIANKVAPTQSLSDDPAMLFKQAKTLLLEGDFPAAETAFSTFVDNHSEAPEAGEAQYWLGESRLIQEAYPEAAEAYITLISQYPNTAKAPDGLVKLARSLRMMGEAEQACGALNEIPVRYPDANAVTRSLAASERSRAKCDTN